jgi:hypothetical protein
MDGGRGGMRDCDPPWLLAYGDGPVPVPPALGCEYGDCRPLGRGGAYALGPV